MAIGFFSLPPELRERIYSHVLISPHPLVMVSNPNIFFQEPQFHGARGGRRGRGTIIADPILAYGGPEAPAVRSMILPSICFANRQIQNECLGLFFGRNRFCLSTELASKLPLQSWLPALGRDNILRMRRIRMEHDADNRAQCTLLSFTVFCDVTLVRRDPGFDMTMDVPFSCYTPDSVARLRDSMDEWLRMTITPFQNFTFAYEYLTALLEYWKAECYKVLLFDSGEFQRAYEKMHDQHRIVHPHQHAKTNSRFHSLTPMSREPES